MNHSVLPLKDPTFERQVGIVVPPANPTVEPEFRALLNQDASIYVTRLPVFEKMSLEERNERYLKSYEESVLSFGNLKLHSILIAVTGPSYHLGLEGDERMCERLSERCGSKVFMISLAINEALQAINCRKIVLVSPYPEWLISKAVRYWEGAGYQVVEIDRIRKGDHFAAYETGTGSVKPVLLEVERHLEDIDHADTAVLVTGTGLLTIETMLEIHDEVRTPLLSSNLCGAWWILRDCGLTKGSDFFEVVSDHSLPPLGESA